MRNLALAVVNIVLFFGSSVMARDEGVGDPFDAFRSVCAAPDVRKREEGDATALLCGSKAPPSFRLTDSGLLLDADATKPDLTLAGTYNPPAIAFGLRNRISFCPELSCVRGPSDGSITPSFFDHQRATVLISGPSQLDGQAQEQLLAVVGTVATGRATPWKPSTAYSKGANVHLINPNGTGAVYRAKSAGTSGKTAPPAAIPASMPFSFRDGTIVWEWISAPAVAVKANFYNEQTVKPGAASTWVQANNVELKPGVVPSFHVNTELDFGNNSGANCGFGNGDCFNLYLRSGGTNMMTGHVQVDGEPSAGNPYAAYFGIRIAGPKAAQIADIITDSSGAVGIGVCSSGVTTCSHSTASINDRSASPVGLKLEGKYSGYAIQSEGFSVDPQGFARVSGLNMRTGTPSSSKSPCNVGDLRFDDNFMYACVGKNAWKRAALSNW